MMDKSISLEEALIWTAFTLSPLLTNTNTWTNRWLRPFLIHVHISSKQQAWHNHQDARLCSQTPSPLGYA
jgi:hypothetical protein